MANKFSKKAAINKKNIENKKKNALALAAIANVILKLIVGLILTALLCIGYYYIYNSNEIRYKVANYSELLVIFTLILTFAIVIILYYLFHGILKSYSKFLFFPSLLIAMYASYYLVFSHPLHSIETNMNEYTNLDGLSRVSYEEYITGKVLVVNRTTKMIDDLFFKLPGDLQARTPEEVKTIISVDCNNNVVGSYEDGENAYRVVCKLIIIDHAKATFVTSKSFIGGEPGSVRYKHSTGVGSIPNEEMVNYILAIPKR